ncbi:MAG: TIR domain-containing protein [Acidobacteriia bacterium]|nr:TIR domain-containing protein [Terriglobia bacterium]
MARRVFFSFHYTNDIWRANQVRNAHVAAGAGAAGFFDRSEYAEAKRSGKDGIARMILRHLRGTSVTVVLIGRETAERPWVKYQIEKSIERKNGLVGIYIHHMKDANGEPSPCRGGKPVVPEGVEFPAYDWDDRLERFRWEIEAAGQRSDALRSTRPPRDGEVRGMNGS